MQIDPLEAIIKTFADKLTLVNGRVAEKHRYGAGWSDDQAGVSIRLDGGAFDIEAPIATPRLEIRIYAAPLVKNQNNENVDGAEMRTAIYRQLVKTCRDNARFSVETSKGRALVHYLKIQSALSGLFDEDISKDFGLLFMEVMIAEDPIT